jgi:hypothetical protein
MSKHLTNERGRKRSKLVLTENLPLEVKWHGEGFNSDEIADRVNDHNIQQGYKCKPITGQTIRNDLRAAVKRWANESIWMINEQRTSEVFKMERVWREAMEAWERSKQQTHRTTVNVGEDKKQVGGATVTRTTSFGQGQFLDTAIRARAEICKILGVYADAPVEPSMSSDGRRRVTVAFYFDSNKSVKELTDFPIIEAESESLPQLGNGEVEHGDRYPNGQEEG